MRVYLDRGEGKDGVSCILNFAKQLNTRKQREREMLDATVTELQKER